MINALRRLWMGIAGLLVLVCAGCNEISGLQLGGGVVVATLAPTISNLQSTVNDTYERLLKWKGQDEVLVFPVITDMHTGSNSLRMQHIICVVESDAKFQYDLLVNLGDVGIDGGDGLSADRDVAETTLRAMQRFDGPSVVCRGNHDTSPAGFTHSMFTEMLQAPLSRKHPKGDYMQRHGCGYIDFEQKRIRIYYLNSSDTSVSPSDGASGEETLSSDSQRYSYSREQLGWIAESLGNLPDGWQVMVLTHYAEAPEAMWIGYDDRAKGAEILYSIINAFQQRRDATVEGIECRFAHLSADTRFIGISYGDRHFDYMGEYHDIHLACTQGYGGIERNFVPQRGVLTLFNPHIQILVDIVAIKPSAREVRYFRLGAGGRLRDRSYHY